MNLIRYLGEINYEKLPEIKKYFKDLLAIKYFKFYFFLLLAINLFVWLAAKELHDAIGAEQMALHYNVNSGFDYYGSTTKIYIIPLIGAIILLINSFIVSAFTGSEYRKFFLHIIMLAALLGNITLLVSVFVLRLVNLG